MAREKQTKQQSSSPTLYELGWDTEAITTFLQELDEMHPEILNDLLTTVFPIYGESGPSGGPLVEQALAEWSVRSRLPLAWIRKHAERALFRWVHLFLDGASLEMIREQGWAPHVFTRDEEGDAFREAIRDASNKAVPDEHERRKILADVYDKVPPEMWLQPPAAISVLLDPPYRATVDNWAQYRARKLAEFEIKLDAYLDERDKQARDGVAQPLEARRPKLREHCRWLVLRVVDGLDVPEVAKSAKKDYRNISNETVDLARRIGPRPSPTVRNVSAGDAL